MCNTLMFTSVLPFKNKVLNQLFQNLKNEKYCNILINLMEDVHLCSLRSERKMSESLKVCTFFTFEKNDSCMNFCPIKSYL